MKNPDPVEKKAHLLVVDDDRIVRLMLEKMLAHYGYSCVLVASAEEALRRLEEKSYDLMLCDMNMPGMSGMELIDKVSQAYPDMATIMITSQDDPALAETAIRLGAYGYLIKPTKENQLFISISNALRRRQLELESRHHREQLENTVLARTRELTQALERLQVADSHLRYAHEETINRLMRVAEFRDNDTALHVQRMSHYCEHLAKLAGLPEAEQTLIRTASAMHDIGKIGIPDNILLKPGRLSPEEFEVMKAHAEIGYHILRGSKVPLLEMAATIALNHHEKFDGTGYPHSIKGENIPIEARITSICDVFDALTNRRVYKVAMSSYDATGYLRESKGTHFDPALLDVFLKNLTDFMTIKAKYPEPNGRH